MNIFSALLSVATSAAYGLIELLPTIGCDAANSFSSIPVAWASLYVNIPMAALAFGIFIGYEVGMSAFRAGIFVMHLVKGWI